MLRQLGLRDLGPAVKLTASFGSRLNMMVGDNGLGKTFLLDIAWWALTRTWAGSMAAPMLRPSAAPSISFVFDAPTRTTQETSAFDRERQEWPRNQTRPPNPGLVVYARVDGGFSVWDPAQNYWRHRASADEPTRPSAFHFTPEQVWAGFDRDRSGKTYCRGLVEDWGSWQRENGEAFRQFCAVLRALSPDGHSLEPGLLTRIPDNTDRRDIPTLQTSLEIPVPIVYAPAAVKRILGMAYLLVWTWTEHQRMSALRGLGLAEQVIFLIDEVEAHLHPRWQRTIVRALLQVVSAMHAHIAVQLIAATHSPLVMASIEPYFDEETDKLLHLALKDRRVILEELPWAKEGDASSWLVSDAFGLAQARSLEAARAIEAAEAWARGDQAALPAGLDTEAAIQRELERVLPSMDPFWPRWLVRNGPAT